MNKKFIGISILVILVLSLMVSAVSAQGGQGRRGRGGNQDRPIVDGIREAVQLISDQTGLTAQEIMAKVREGETLATIITTNGGDLDAIVDQLVANAQERLNQAVTNGRITQERADAMLEDARTRIDTLLNATSPMQGQVPAPRENLRERFLSNIPLFDGIIHQAMVDAGLDAAQIRTQLAEGATLRQILTDAGLDVEALVSDVLSQARSMMDDTLASGRITQEQVEQRLTDLEARINEILDKTHTPVRTRTRL